MLILGLLLRRSSSTAGSSYYDVGSRNSDKFFKLSEICIPATAFVSLIKSYFGIQLRLVSIHEEGHFFLKLNVGNARLTTS